MSSEAKRIKLLTLAELVLGVAILVLGVVMLIQGKSSTPNYVLCGEGLLTFVFGVRGSLIANVPARMGKLVPFGAIVLLCQIACAAGIVYLVGTDKVGDELPVVCASVAPALVTLVAVILARGMAKRAER